MGGCGWRGEVGEAGDGVGRWDGPNRPSSMGDPSKPIMVNHIRMGLIL